MLSAADTIAAIATAAGNAALGIVRISGPDAKDVLQKVVPAANAMNAPRQLRFGRARDIESGVIIDEVLCFYAPAPATATGEDVAEIHGHGGALVLNQLLRQVLHAGARLATPGEFTRRAYTNGKMDLTQAEAVMSLIGARSERAARTAARQLGGAIGEALAAEYDHVTRISAMLEVCLDFPDEDLPAEQTFEFIKRLTEVSEKLLGAVRSYRMGQLLTRGAKVVIAGPSNAGKSSLLNALINEDKALVDSVPGTTRDIVEAPFEIDGIPVTFLDTAGLRFGAKKVEQMGMEKSRKALSQADLILLVLDGGDPKSVTKEIVEIVDLYEDSLIPVLNKCDLPLFDSRAFPAALKDAVQISASNKLNLDELHQEMSKKLSAGQATDVILTTARQLTAVETALDHITTAKIVLEDNGPPELAAADMRWAREALASLWGRDAQTDVIDTIFLSFCLGK
ncbi:MAG: tRNA uridine-5-carboxymethylaminomethyl(34) synthesis GTPase MnmE [Deltaproteobacteria bacterium]|nr:tRNA uridine-5-carboxymethylaminomethyl(34) synthesis GTPase MnmE [Deltaproteobacteria bacterium]